MVRTPLLAISVAAALAVSGAALAQKKADKDSQSFIKKAIEHNYAEIDLGKLAQEKGKSPEVKQFGATLVKDHSDANEKAIAAAKQMNVNPPGSADMMHQASYLKFKALSGDSFDKSFANSMVKDHQADIKDFQKESQKSDAAGQFAKEILPKLQEHLQMAQSLQKSTTTGSGDRNK
jgi:putative membrane protein